MYYKCVMHICSLKCIMYYNIRTLHIIIYKHHKKINYNNFDSVFFELLQKLI